MRLPRAALFVSFVSLLAITACSKPAEEPAPEAHDAEATDGTHAEAATDDVVTMEQAVEDARAAAEAPAGPAPVPASEAAAAEGHDTEPGDHAASAEAPPAAAAEHAAGH